MGTGSTAIASAQSIATTNVSATRVTLQLTSITAGTGYFTLLAGSGTSCGSAVQTVAGQDSHSATAYRLGSLPLAASVAGNYTVGNLTASTNYTICFTPDGTTTPVTANVSTTAAVTPATPAWAALAGAGFSHSFCDACSLAFAPDGTPYLSQTDAFNYDALTVSMFDGTSWVPVGTAAFVVGADFATMAFSPDGTPYVMYQDENTNYALTVMRFSGGAWSLVGSADFSSAVDDGTYPYYYDDSSLAFGPDGTPYVAFTDASNGSAATLMKYNGSAWTIVGSAGFTPGTAYGLSFAFGSDGTPYVAFADGTQGGNVSAMRYSGGSWAYMGAPGFSTISTSLLQLAVSPDGTPYVVYSDAFGSAGSVVTKFSGGSWSTVGSGFTNAIYAMLAFGPNGAPSVATMDGPTYSASVRQFDGSSWSLIGNSGFSQSEAGLSSFAFGPDGTPYVAYVDFGDYDYGTTVMRWFTAPSATTGSATNITDLSALLNGTSNDNGLNTTVKFDIGLDTTYGVTLTASTPSSGTIAAGSGSTAASARIRHLIPSTIFHYRIDATANGATVYGADTTFTAADPPLPTVTSVTPSTGSTSGGTTVTIKGTSFTLATAVTFGTTPATNFVVHSDHTITAVAPANIGGVADVTVTNTTGTSAVTPADQFTYVWAVPTVTGISPVSGSMLGGTPVVITGTGFIGATAVNFGSSVSTSILVSSDTSIIASSPAASLGAVDVTVTTPGGTSTTSSADQFTYVPPATGTIATANLGANQVTLKLTSSQTSEGYFTLLVGSGTTCGTAAQTIAGEDSTGAAASRFGSLPLAATVTGNYTVSNLIASAAYTVCFTPDGSTAPVTTNVTTTASPSTASPGWGLLDSRGFTPGEADYTSLAFAPDGTPYMAYSDGAGGQAATVVKFNGSQWLPFGGTAFSPGQALFTTLVFAPDGTMYVGFWDGSSGGGLTVMTYSGGSWVSIGTAFTGVADSGPSLAFSPDGHLYAAFADSNNNFKATVAMYSGSGTTWTTVGGGGFSTGFADAMSLAFGTDGTPYVAFEDYDQNSHVTVMKYSSGSWSNVGAAGFSPDTASQIKLAVAPNGTPYLIYSDFSVLNGTTVMKYASGSWSLVGSAGFSGPAILYPTLAFGPDGSPYAAYTDSNIPASGATVVRFDGSTWSSVGGIFTPDPGLLISLAFAPDGLPYIAYTDFGTSNDGATVRRLVTAPMVTTGSATSVTTTTATLNGTVNDNGVATTVAFEYATDADYIANAVYSTNVTATTPASGAIAAGTGSTSASVGLTGLTLGTTYHFRAIATGNGATVYGNDVTFTTPGGPPVALAFGASPAATITAGDNAGSAITVEEEDAGGNVVTTATDTITLTVTGPNSYSHIYNATASAGVVMFNLASIPLTVAGSYTYTASFTGLTSAVASETVNAGTTTRLHFASPASAFIGVPASFTMTALDAHNNITTGYSGTVMFTSSDSHAVLPANTTFTNGMATVFATYETTGTQNLNGIDTASPSINGSGSVPVTYPGYVWAIYANGTVAKQNEDGTSAGVSGGTAGTTSTAGGGAVTSSGSIWVVTSANNLLESVSSSNTQTYTGGGLNAPAGVAVDSAGNVWIANSGSATISEFNSSGTAVSPSAGFSAVSANPTGIAVDASGSVWTSNSVGTVTRVVGAAAPTVTPTISAEVN